MKKDRSSLISLIALLFLSLPMVPRNSLAQERDHDRDHPRFEDKDRQTAKAWFNEHHDRLPEGLRERDRLSPELESRLQIGVVLDNDLRHRIHPVPADLLDRLPPCPPHHRYVVVGGHIVLIDDGFHVYDVIHFEL